MKLSETLDLVPLEDLKAAARRRGLDLVFSNAEAANIILEEVADAFQVHRTAFTTARRDNLTAYPRFAAMVIFSATQKFTHEQVAALMDRNTSTITKGIRRGENLLGGCSHFAKRFQIACSRISARLPDLAFPLASFAFSRGLSPLVLKLSPKSSVDQFSL